MAEEKLPPLDEYLSKHLGKGARLAQALPGAYQDTYLYFIAKKLEELAGPSSSNGDGNGNIHPAAGFTELIDPRLANWRYFTKPFTNITIGANAQYKLYPYTIDEWGTVLITAVRMTSPDCRLTVKVYSADGQYLDINNTARELLALGRVTAPPGLAFDLNKYNDTQNLYAFELRAPWPGLPFYKKVEIWLTNETASSITLLDATVTIIKLDK